MTTTELKQGNKIFYWEFAIVAISYLLISIFSNSTILADRFNYELLINEVSGSDIQEMARRLKNVQLITLFLLPLLLLLKIYLLALLIFGVLSLREITVSLKSLLTILVEAEFAVLLGSLVKVGYLYLYPVDTIDEINRFSPLSLYSAINQAQIPSYLVYILKQLNIFEILYWVILIFGLKKVLSSSFGYAFKITATSYGLIYALWLALFTFIQILFSR